MPSPKEKECIEYAMAFREKMAEAEISRKKTTNKKTPIILTPKQFEQEIASDAFKAMRRLPFHKKVLLLFVFVILYLLYFPLYFLLGILDLFPDSKKSQRRIEEEIRKKYRIDYETSDVKTFQQLWFDKGLQDWGITHWHLKFKEEEQLDCIFKWYQILYNKGRSEFDFICIELGVHTIQHIGERRKARVLVNPASLAMQLVEEFDKRYGNYE